MQERGWRMPKKVPQRLAEKRFETGDASNLAKSREKGLRSAGRRSGAAREDCGRRKTRGKMRSGKVGQDEGKELGKEIVSRSGLGVLISTLEASMVFNVKTFAGSQDRGARFHSVGGKGGRREFRKRSRVRKALRVMPLAGARARSCNNGQGGSGWKKAEEGRGEGKKSVPGATALEKDKGRRRRKGRGNYLEKKPRWRLDARKLFPIAAVSAAKKGTPLYFWDLFPDERAIEQDEKPPGNNLAARWKPPIVGNFSRGTSIIPGSPLVRGPHDKPKSQLPKASIREGKRGPKVRPPFSRGHPSQTGAPRRELICRYEVPWPLAPGGKAAAALTRAANYTLTGRILGMGKCGGRGAGALENQ
ncbi:hypothetical protein KM043_002964 [Ampulex compressa]|nr:hypothetical protein KM043_002964 [Ampulex compressa]